MVSPELNFCMAADAGQLFESRQQVRGFLSSHGVESQAADDIVLSVHEACTNAIEHSHTAQAIDVALRLEGAQLSVVVADGGCGLDVDSEQPRGRPGLHLPKGRGLYLMASLMDEFDVHRDGGTEIRMTKRLGKIEDSPKKEVVMASSARDLVGLEAVTRDGDEIGPVKDVISDPDSGSEYLVIRFSLLRDLVVPAHMGTRCDEGVVIPYARLLLRAAPRVATKGPLSVEDSKRLEDFYQSRAA